MITVHTGSTGVLSKIGQRKEEETRSPKKREQKRGHVKYISELEWEGKVQKGKEQYISVPLTKFPHNISRRSSLLMIPGLVS